MGETALWTPSVRSGGYRLRPIQQYATTKTDPEDSLLEGPNAGRGAKLLAARSAKVGVINWAARNAKEDRSSQGLTKAEGRLARPVKCCRGKTPKGGARGAATDPAVRWSTWGGYQCFRGSSGQSVGDPAVLPGRMGSRAAHVGRGLRWMTEGDPTRMIERTARRAKDTQHAKVNGCSYLGAVCLLSSYLFI